MFSGVFSLKNLKSTGTDLDATISNVTWSGILLPSVMDHGEVSLHYFVLYCFFFKLGGYSRVRLGCGWVLAKRHIEVCKAIIVGHVILPSGRKVVFSALEIPSYPSAHLEMS